MIHFTRHTLPNGLRVLHHRDAMTRMVAVNLLYDVGSRDETPGRTGLAHLMEHLMFSGTKQAPHFDRELQQSGGTSNAWTSSDLTNYYDVLPSQNVATALWLERDRLLDLTLDPTIVDTQLSVVVEEFKQRCLNVPYGDLTHLMHSMAFTVHPYRWPTLGLSVEEVAALTRDDVLAFRHGHYSVDRLVLCLSGNIEADRAFELAEHWLGDVEPRRLPPRRLPQEPEQTEPRTLTVQRDVPHDLLLIAYKMCGRAHSDFVVCDLLTDLLAGGKSARFTRNVLAQSDVFMELDAAVEGTVDPGLLLIRGKLRPGSDMAQAEALVQRELALLANEGALPQEIEKCANKYESNARFENLSYLQKATRLCTYEMLGDAAMANDDLLRYRAVTTADVCRVASALFRPEKSCTIRYVSTSSN